MNRVKTVVVGMVLLAITLVVPVYATTISDWLRTSEISMALTLPDGSYVELHMEDIVKIRADLDYIVLAEPFSRKDRLICLMPVSPALRLGQSVNVSGNLVTLMPGVRALQNVTIQGFASESGELLYRPSLIKWLYIPAWPWMIDLTVRDSMVSMASFQSFPPNEPNTDFTEGPTYYPSIADILYPATTHTQDVCAQLDNIGDVLGLPGNSLVYLESKRILASDVQTINGTPYQYIDIAEDLPDEDWIRAFYTGPTVAEEERVHKLSAQVQHLDPETPVLCVNDGPSYNPQILEGSLSTVNPQRVAYARTLLNGATATLEGVVVSANQQDFPDTLYVQETNRSGGIRVRYSGATIARGSIVDVAGTIFLAADGEREIDAGSTGVSFIEQSTVPGPFGMPNKHLGGAWFNAYTPGIDYPTGSGIGLYNKGLLVKSWGTVTFVDSSNKFFYIDDGTRFEDGSGNTGVKVSWAWPTAGKPAITPPQVGWYVSVTGLSSSETMIIDQGQVLIRVLRPRDQSDLVVLSPQDVARPDISITSPSGTLVHKPVGASSITVTGTATVSDSQIVAVEVKIDSGQWQPATYNAVDHTWSFQWQNPQSGKIWARAVDVREQMSVVSRDVTVVSLVFVDGRLASSGDGSGWLSGKRTIQEALNIATSGSEIWVAQGVYQERITMKSGVALYGGFSGSETTRSQRNWNTNVTIIDGNQAGTVLTVPSGATSATRIDGFTIRNGRASSGAGISCSGGSPVIANNTITGNMATSETASVGGGGIFIASGDPHIYNNKICGNSACFGGGIYCWGNSPKIYNNTIVSNSGSEGGGISCYDYCSASISNNIIAFNSSGIYKTTSGSVTLRNNCVYGNGVYDYYGISAGTGDISSDPKLASVQYADFHIQPDSPCINAGYNDAVLSCSVDFDGQIRIQGSHVDIGVDESNGTQFSVSAPRIVRVDRVNGNDYRDGSTWALAVQSIQKGIDLAGPTGGEVWVKAGTTYSGSYGRINNLRPYVYVYGGFTGNESERSERDWVGNETVLDGGQSGQQIVTSMSPGYCVSSIDGFKIFNGRASNGPGIYCNIYSSPAIVNNNITGNTATDYGGGIYCFYSSPYIANNQISGNSAKSGGAVYCLKGSPVILNNTLDNNTVTSEAGGIYCEGRAVLINKNTIKNHEYNGVYTPQGGGIFCNAVRSVTITANRFENNTGWTGGGALYLMSSPNASVVNNLFVSCTAKNGGGGALRSYQSTPRIVNNTFALNRAFGQGGAIALFENDYYRPTQVINNIFYNNRSEISGIGHSVYGSYGSYYVDVRYCDAFSDQGTGSSYHYSGVYVESTSKYLDPDFCEVTGENPYWLSPTSPIRGMGQNPSSNSLVPKVDVYGLPRPGKNGTTDPGPYEDGPFVRIASPQNGTMYGDEIENIRITAETSGDVSSVSYTATKVGDPNSVYEFGPVGSAPYRVTWLYPPEGRYELVATAGFAGGVTATSAPVLISIKGFCYPEGTDFRAISPYETDEMMAMSGTSSPKWLKGGLHVHWYDDNNVLFKKIGTKSKKPAEVADLYEGMGYDFIAVTEHNHLTPPRGNHLGSNFVWLENCEEVTPYDADGKTLMNHILAIGVNGKSASGSRDYDISRDVVIQGHKYAKWSMPARFTTSDYEFIPKSKDYDYVAGQNELLFHNVSRTRMFDTIDTMKGLPFVPHPTASSPLAGGQFTENELFDIASERMRKNKFLAIACYTRATPPFGAHWSSQDGWDAGDSIIEALNCRLAKKFPKKMLPFTFSEEDYTPGLTKAGDTWIYLKVDDPGNYWDTASNHYRSERIKNALRKGIWWSCHTHGSSRTCPQLDVRVSGSTITCTSPTAVKWTIRGPQRRGSSIIKEIGKSDSATTSFTKTLERCSVPDWIVIIAKNDNGLVAESQPIRLLPTGSSGRASTLSSGLTVEYLDPDNYPEEMPPLGCVGGIYQVSGDLQQSSTLTLSFAGADVTALGIHNLRIFYYDPVTSTWSELSSTLDMQNQELSAQITALGIYTISAVETTDVQAPTVTWLLPLANAYITGATDLEVNAEDNVGISSIAFYLTRGTNVRRVAVDSTLADGRWGASVDFSPYVSGNYVLKAEATDASGNIGIATVPVTIQSGATAPQVTIDQPTFDAETGAVIVTGTASDADGPVAYVNIELDGQIEGIASLSEEDNTWSFAFGDFGPGRHVVRAVAGDEYGNEGAQEIGVELSLSGVQLSTDPDAQCLPSESVTLTAAAVGGTTVEYRFLVYDGAQWTVLQEFSNVNTCAWTPAVPKTYTLRVCSREQGTTYPEFNGDMQFLVAGYLSGVDLSADLSPRAVDAPVRVYATPVGGSNLEYKFEANGQIIQDWATADTCQWVPTETGTYALTVYAREQGTTSPVFDDTEASYIITDPVAAVSLTANLTSPQQVSTPILLTAVPTGGGTVEYFFDVSEDGGVTWSLLRNFETASTFQWIPSAAGAYKLRVTARDQGTEEDVNPEVMLDYVINP